MSLVHVSTREKDPKPDEEHQLVYDTSNAAEMLEKIDPRDIHIMVLYRGGEGIHEITQDSIYTWLDFGCKFTRFRDAFGGWINTTRNWQTRYFLKHSNAKYLQLIDADVAVRWEIPFMLGSHRKPIVSALVPCYSVDRGGLFLNVAVKDPHGTARFPTLNETKTIPRKGLIECHNAGTGCLLVRRDVLERLWEMSEQDENFGQPFELPIKEQRMAGMTGAVPRGEDICFTDRARAAGYQVFTDFEARCLHDKAMTLYWPENYIADIDPEDWAVSVFDKKVVQV